MKTTKRLLAILVSFIMVLMLALPALAADETGSIAITNAVPGQTYSVYRIFDLESYDKEHDAYVYSVNQDWQAFIAEDAISGPSGYIAVDNNGHVTWSKKDTLNQNTGMEEFSKLALDYAKSNSISAVSTQTAGAAAEGQITTTLTFSDLALGYYLLDSNVGTLCTLTTTNPVVEITDKNGQPTVEKKVQENNDGSWSDKNGVQIGDTVNFKVTITAQAGAQSYILHEKMDDGLTFNAQSVTVSKGNQTVAPSGNYEVKTNDVSDGCTFEVVFSDNFCGNLSANDQVVVTYNAVLNEKADVENGEDNEVYLSYGENSSIQTQPDETTTETYQFQVIKTNDKQDENGKYELLEGAQFSLFTEETGGDSISFVKESEAVYRVATPGEIADSTIEKFTKIPAGQPILKGLDNKTYYLEEVDAPDGYNPVEGRIAVDLTQGSNLAGIGAINTTANTFDPDVLGGVQVQNSKGNLLPSTGGIGTIIFYVLGGILVVGAGFALFAVSRKSKKYARK